MSLFGDEDLAPVVSRESSLDFWNQTEFERLQTQFKAGTMHHAILLLGAEGIGRDTFADELARWVLCANRDELTSACGQCKPCSLVDASSHPDYHLLEVEEDKTQISVNQVRDLIASMHESAHQNGWKVANITEVSALNQSSYNALLKTLEEPAADTLLILQADQLQQVPATIRSRSQLLALTVEDKNAISDWLAERNGHITDDLSLALNLFPQAPYKAEDFAKNGDAFKCGEFIFDVAAIVDGEKMPLAVAELWLPEVENCLLWMQLMMRDLLLIAETGASDNLCLKNQQIALDRIVKAVNNQGLIQLNEKIVELRSLIMRKSPVNLSSSWQALLIYLVQVAARFKRTA